MSEKKQSEQSSDGLSRRGFLGTAAAATAGMMLAPSYASGFARTPGYVQGAGPNSKFGNVQIGTITYSFRSMPGANDPEQVLSYIVSAGLSSTELMGDPIMRWLGAPTTTGIPNANAIAQMTDPAQRQAAQRQRDAADAEMRRFYAAGPDLTKLAALKKMYNDAGVTIHITKLNAGTPEAAAFAFQTARALGARGNTAELGEEAARLQGPIAERYGVKAIMHNHAQPGAPNFPGFDHFLAISPGVALNLDVGHYYGSTGKNPVPEITRLNQRIFSMHMKDKTSPAEGDQNMPWGFGGTPLAEILRTVNKNGYNINADIELEYAIPAGSNAVKEVAKSLEFARFALTTPVPVPQQRQAPAAAPAAPRP